MTSEQIQGLARVAKAIEIRRDDVVAEMEAALRLRDEAYAQADALLATFDELAKERVTLTRSLWLLEQKLAEAAFALKDRTTVEIAA